jgi:hypothetical protein
MVLGLAEALVPEEVPLGCKPINTELSWRKRKRLVYEARPKEIRVDFCPSKPKQPVSGALLEWLMFVPHSNWVTVALDKCQLWSNRSC